LGRITRYPEETELSVLNTLYHLCVNPFSDEQQISDGKLVLARFPSKICCSSEKGLTHKWYKVFKTESSVSSGYLVMRPKRDTKRQRLLMSLFRSRMFLHDSGQSLFLAQSNHPLPRTENRILKCKTKKYANISRVKALMTDTMLNQLRIYRPSVLTDNKSSVYRMNVTIVQALSAQPLRDWPRRSGIDPDSVGLT